MARSAVACALLHATAVWTAVWTPVCTVWAEEGPKPFVRTGLGPKTVTVGQPVTLTVDVFVPTWFTSAPKFPPIEVKDAIVMFLEQGGENLNENVGDQSYAGQRRQYLIYPQRAGDYEVPAFEVKVRYAIDAKPSSRTAVPGRGGRFSATIPAAAAGLGYFLATPSFKMTETTDRLLEGLRVGDSFTRTVAMTASDAFAIMLPPLRFEPVDGVSVYPAKPVVSDSGGERDVQRVGKRVESATYMLRQEGDFELPEIQVAWWDTFARQLRRETLPATTVHVAANPALAAEIPLPPDAEAAPSPGRIHAFVAGVRRYGRYVLGAAVAVALLLRLFRSRIEALRATRAARRRQREDSEAAALERLKQAARAGRASELLAATYRWLDRRANGAAATRLDVLAAGSGDPALPALADEIVSSALAGVESIPPEAAQRFVRGLRTAARRQSRHPPPSGALGPLNPRRS
jgi:hypothetical protein